jgi:hypothetical protein
MSELEFENLPDHDPVSQVSTRDTVSLVLSILKLLPTLESSPSHKRDVEILKNHLDIVMFQLEGLTAKDRAYLKWRIHSLRNSNPALD